MPGQFRKVARVQRGRRAPIRLSDLSRGDAMFRRVVVGGALVGALLLSGCGVSATPADDPTAAGSSAAKGAARPGSP